MRCRLKSKPDVEGGSSRFNVHALFEVIMYFDEDQGGCDSVPGSDVEVYVEKLAAWKPLGQAIRDRDVITDNVNSEFAEPATLADRERGYWL